MLMGYKDRKYKRSRHLLDSFKHAFTGIKTAVAEERNMKIHLIVALVVLACAGGFQVTKSEWLILLICIFIVIILEMVNTAIERAVDTVTTEFLPEAKKAKDVAAGAVLIASLMSFIIGLIIFIPYVLAIN
ncbi:diacylglycerol kinase family protein [Listeria fleischmannii]|jgi:diacylglycerol kinase|nr:diacylglycerol kinase family protein [Listeria fleischmannii]EIA19539.1 hypothetical protein KKC_11858 [Listeria fleischmannii subsp. coloradonensis]